ncbi:unnamed protein product [Phytophthora lilii]|uniref:Unnamed protein product n=1 Tax=Phytophthora lilii TaxID=2077276 RepID=A0A9W6WNA2_9STRA|nr:unnamed protein product [Phytophthora lilii]
MARRYSDTSATFGGAPPLLGEVSADTLAKRTARIDDAVEAVGYDKHAADLGSGTQRNARRAVGDDDGVSGTEPVDIDEPVLQLKWIRQSDPSRTASRMERLDADYALLRDVSARNRTLQARLRGSLPLLWTDSALVMTSAAPRRRRVAEQSAAGEADQMLLTLEGQAGLQVGRRYKRRVEWEVARRIARVDRELQQYPPAQRFWNQKSKETPKPASFRRGVGRKDLQEKTQRDEVGKRKKAPTERNAERKVEAKRPPSVVVGKIERDPHETKVWTKPNVVAETGRDKRKVVKHIATSPLRAESERIEDKENMIPNSATSALINSGSNVEASFLRNESPRNDNEKEYNGMAESSPNKAMPQEPVDVSEIQSADSTVQAKADVDAPGQSRTTPLSSAVSTEKEKDGHDEVDIESLIEQKSPLHGDSKSENRPSSSIGRQVLSEFRTMPSVASFGAPPTLSVGGLGRRGETRLNADMLRRLFSDLDTDRDGHLNRIETCMALHRLQISVPTTTIISFFRRIHSSSSGKSVRSRDIQHLPMKEVINYKEFVAFVTAAHDQQQQQKLQLRKTAIRRNLSSKTRAKVQPPPPPSTSLPIYANPTSLLDRPPRQATPVVFRDQEVRVYELNDDKSEPEGASFEEIVMREIPDFLVSRILSSTNDSIAHTKKTTASVVRKSLESLAGRESIDDQIVNEITQELLRERLRSIATFGDEDKEDITGLRRAAAYYDAQAMQNGAESNSVADDSSSGELVNWVDVLTEEQVSGLVQQIWKDREASLSHAHLERVNVSNVEEPPDTPDKQAVVLVDGATDTPFFDKGVQASSIENEDETSIIFEVAASTALKEERKDTGISPPDVSTSLESANPLQTHLARAICMSLESSEHLSQELLSPVTPIQILQQLRQQRKRRVVLDNLQTQPLSASIKAEYRPNAIKRVDKTPEAFINEEDLSSLEDESTNFLPQGNFVDEACSTENQGLLPDSSAEPIPLVEKILNVESSASVASSSSELVGRSSISLSSSISSGYRSMDAMFGETDRHQLNIQRHRPYRRRKRILAGSQSGSSVPDSICSAELSEGELSREEVLELSDGEIFGECKMKYGNEKKTTLGTIESVTDENDLRTSVESGELPALVRTNTV